MKTKFISLRLKLAFAFASLMIIMGLFFYWFFPSRAEESALKGAQSRATDIALVLGNAILPALDFGIAQGAEKSLSALASADGATYGAVYQQDGAILAAWNSENIPQVVDLPGNKPMVNIREGQLHVTTSLITETQAQGILRIGFSLEKLEIEKQENRYTIGIVLLIVTGLGILLAIWVGVLLVRPVSALTKTMSRIVETGYLEKINIQSNDEVGQLTVSIKQLLGWLRNIVSSLNNLAKGLDEIISQLSLTGTTVSRGATMIRSQMSHSTLR